MEKDKIAFKGSNPDSLYRVGPGAGATGKLSRAARVLRWPAALLTICVALTLFVYFLIPSSVMDMDIVNGTAWDVDIAEAAAIGVRPHNKIRHKAPDVINSTKPNNTETLPPGATIPTGNMKTTEVDFYENEQTILPDILANREELPAKKNILSPVFPENINPEVQYGNEKADTDGFRSGIPQVLRDIIVPEDSTMRARITQKPEKPLTIYFNDAERIVSTTTEIQDTTNLPNTNFEFLTSEKTTTTTEKSIRSTETKETPRLDISDDILIEDGEKETETYSEMGIVSIGDPESEESNFTSGHSKLFGISVEDAEKMKSTTQNSVYNTRVSPTLPTWHDGDDTTTKNYPGTANLDVPQCSSTRLEICRGILPYDLTGAPLKMAGVDVSSLLPQLQQLMSSNCSARLPQFVCVLLEPECSAPPYPPRMPCYNLCRTIVEQCESQIPSELSPVFNCNLFSSSNCLSARVPCATSELACGDGSCVPQAWACDGARDCPGGEDEDTVCATCSKYEYRCQSGTCIVNQWLCDGFSDCPGGEDEAENMCETWEGRGGRMREPEDVLRGIDEEAAESAPTPSIRHPGRLQVAHNTGEIDASKELLVTSDTNNGLKRNFTRRPSLSRLTPYSPPPYRKLPEKLTTGKETKPKIAEEKYQKQRKQPVIKVVGPNVNGKYEDVNYADFYDDYRKELPLQEKTSDKISKNTDVTPGISERKSATRLDTSLDNLELVIDGAAMLKKATTTTVKDESPEYDDFPTQNKGGNASPCPTGELRCVDGRCITLAQLCDGTVDCSDHADEDNCYT